MKKVINVLQYFIFVFFLIVLSIIAIIKIRYYSYIYVSLGWVVILAAIAIVSQADRNRLAAIYLAAIFMAFFIGELLFLSLDGGKKQEYKQEIEQIYGGRNESRRIIGYAPVKSSQWREVVSYGDTVIYDVVQTIDSFGNRHIPLVSKGGAVPILFFGCSFTFGTGLNDGETLPYYFQASSSDTFRSINMAYMGYGVHQTLAMLHFGLEKKLLAGRQPQAAFYSAITDHVFRGTGHFAENFGPAYSINDSGQLVNRGVVPFSTAFRESRIDYELRKSYVLRRTLLQRRKAKKSQVDLFIAMIERSAIAFEKRYDSPFYVVLWDELDSEQGLYETLLARMKKRNIKVLEIKEILPEYNEKKEKYFIPMETHPSAESNRLIADYLSGLLTTNTLVELGN